MTDNTSGGRVLLRVLHKWRQLLIVILVPLIFLPVVFIGSSKVASCAYGVLVIGIFWVTEALPLAVTSLLPVLIFPILGVIPVTQICASYFKETLMLFIGSLIVAVAVEKWNLHRRIALRALTLVGPEPKMLMLGIMLPCWFLSMWMSNTATTAMMVPILNAILSQIKESRKVDVNGDGAEHKAMTDKKESSTELQTLNAPETESELNHVSKSSKACRLDNEDDDFVNLAKTFAMCIAFSANIGGIATLTGTPPNIVFKGLADELFEDYGIDSGITFANWLVVGFPLSVICLACCWLWLQVYYEGKGFFLCKKRKNSYDLVKYHLLKEYNSLGPMTFAEAIVLIDFVMLAVLWVTRNPQIVPGWGALFPAKYVGDSCPAVLMAVLLFVLPSKPPSFRQIFRKSPDEENDIDADSEDDNSDSDEYIPLLDWETVNRKLAWGVIILMGGGFALADACSASGLSGWVSDQLIVLNVMPPWAIALVLAFIIAAATNITSNAATATLFLPIVGNLAIQLEINPLYFMIPCALAASFAFLLPVGTPPNAIVFATGYLNIKDMLIGGSVINIISILFVSLAMNAWVNQFYGLYILPDAFRKDPIQMTTLTSINSSYTYNASCVC
ncbi:solute carrier family 13 member 5-like [Mizuhopecten yessoensis]|uniref:Solute carrier family 13 member 3 n=1 Tax=Mizuhopecten yessoensis TaxID=6573 RepID=A0A210PQM2_MIZYE|nr:solute carrier family 13 member 5-like [Mizuhopecten yessoensis]OWF38805.1 Solute carrier family 13 member 3 [Mizuhopecten yessoensis]